MSVPTVIAFQVDNIRTIAIPATQLPAKWLLLEAMNLPDFINVQPKKQAAQAALGKTCGRQAERSRVR